MRLNATLNNVQSFFETIGYLRFSNFYSDDNSSKGNLVEKVGRAVATSFVALSLVDFMFCPLPFTIKFIVNGGLIAIISSLAINLLLKSVQQIFDSPSEFDSDDEDDFKVGNKKLASFDPLNDVSEEMFPPLPQSPIRRESPTRTDSPYSSAAFVDSPPVDSPFESETPSPKSKVKENFPNAKRKLLPEFDKVLNAESAL